VTQFQTLILWDVMPCSFIGV